MSLNSLTRLISLRNYCSLLKNSHIKLVPLIDHDQCHVRSFSNWKIYKIVSTQSRSLATNSSSSPSGTGLANQILEATTIKTDEKTKEEEEEERKKKENAARALNYTLIGLGAMFLTGAGYVFFVWGSPLKDRFGHEVPDQFSHLPLLEQYYRRCVSEIWNYKTFLAAPSREKLLPDPVKPPYIQPPYTILLEITDVLVHPEWTYRTGWRFKKRPGVDYFFSQLASGHNFEIVIYTQESGFTAFPIVDALDSQKVLMYTLYRDSTKYSDGHHIKDLDKINRDLSRVIMVDCNPNSVKDHRNNAIVLPKWFGNDDDRTLFDLAALLNAIVSTEVTDVRQVLEHYSNFDDPIEEFKKKQREFAEREKERQQFNLKQKPGLPSALPSFSFVPNFLKRN